MSSNTSLQNMALLLAALDHGPSRKGLSADQIAGIDDCIIVSLDFEAWERAPRPVTEFGVLCLDTRDIDISDAGLTIDKVHHSRRPHHYSPVVPGIARSSVPTTHPGMKTST